jgi:hypothetical protein
LKEETFPGIFCTFSLGTFFQSCSPNISTCILPREKRATGKSDGLNPAMETSLAVDSTLCLADKLPRGTKSPHQLWGVDIKINELREATPTFTYLTRLKSISKLLHDLCLSSALRGGYEKQTHLDC